MVFINKFTSTIQLEALRSQRRAMPKADDGLGDSEPNYTLSSQYEKRITVSKTPVTLTRNLLDEFQASSSNLPSSCHMIFNLRLTRRGNIAGESAELLPLLLKDTGLEDLKNLTDGPSMTFGEHDVW